MKTNNKFKEASVEEFIEAIRKLPHHDIRDGWIHWLSDYNNPGMYNRKPDQDHSARYAYNHIVYPEMLLWLIRESGVSDELVKLAKSDSEKFSVLRQQAAAIRKRVPWDMLERALWKLA